MKRYLDAFIIARAAGEGVALFNDSENVVWVAKDSPMTFGLPDVSDVSFTREEVIPLVPPTVRYLIRANCIRGSYSELRSIAREGYYVRTKKTVKSRDGRVQARAGEKGRVRDVQEGRRDATGRPRFYTYKIERADKTVFLAHSTTSLDVFHPLGKGSRLVESVHENIPKQVEKLLQEPRTRQMLLFGVCEDFQPL